MGKWNNDAKWVNQYIDSMALINVRDTLACVVNDKWDEEIYLTKMEYTLFINECKVRGIVHRFHTDYDGYFFIIYPWGKKKYKYKIIRSDGKIYNNYDEVIADMNGNKKSLMTCISKNIKYKGYYFERRKNNAV